MLLNDQQRRFAIWALQCVPAVIFLAVVLLFSSLSDRFLQAANFLKIVDQTVPVAILAIGMTFVLLTAGIDLAVGSTMYLSVVAFGLLAPDAGPWVALALAATTGLAVGLFHGLWVAWLSVPPFIVTLATLFVIRGAGRAITHTQPVRVAPAISEFNRAELLGIPFAVWTLLVVLAVSWVFLARTSLGRQFYAVGEDAPAASKAGLPLRSILMLAYMACGLCAGIVGFISVAQQGGAPSNFGAEKEFAAIAAAVLGGISLFGGQGSVFGAVLGALLIKTLESGLIAVNADPYIYPLVTGAFIFLAVLLDSLRRRLTDHLNRRLIIPGDVGPGSRPG